MEWCAEWVKDRKKKKKLLCSQMSMSFNIVCINIKTCYLWSTPSSSSSLMFIISQHDCRICVNVCVCVYMRNRTRMSAISTYVLTWMDNKRDFVNKIRNEGKCMQHTCMWRYVDGNKAKGKNSPWDEIVKNFAACYVLLSFWWLFNWKSISEQVWE